MQPMSRFAVALVLLAGCDSGVHGDAMFDDLPDRGLDIGEDGGVVVIVDAGDPDACATVDAGAHCGCGNIVAVNDVELDLTPASCGSVECGADGFLYTCGEDDGWAKGSPASACSCADGADSCVATNACPSE